MLLEILDGLEQDQRGRGGGERGDAAGAAATKKMTMSMMTPHLWLLALQICAVSGREKTLRAASSPAAPRPSAALGILQTMYKQGGCKPNVRHYTAYLKALSTTTSSETGNDGSAAVVEESIRLLEHMAGVNSRGNEEEGRDKPSTNSRRSYGWESLPSCPPDMVAIQTVLGIASRSNNYTAARQILTKMRQGELGRSVLYPDEYCYNLLLGSCQDPDQVRDVIREMRYSRRHRYGAVPPSAVSYTTAIAVCRKTGDVDTCRDLIEQNKNDGLVAKPDVYMYSAAIWTAATAGDYQYAKDLFDEMQQYEDCEANVVSYNGLIAACLAQKTKRSSTSRQYIPDSVCFSNHQNIHEAVTIYSTMKTLDTATTRKSRISPSLVTYQLLARSLRSVRDLDERLVLLTRIFDVMTPDEWTVDVAGPIIDLLISTYGALGLYDDAIRAFNSIQGSPDAACLRAILFACSTAKPYPRWQEALEMLHASDTISGTESPEFVDPASLSHAMIACNKANRWEDSLELLRLYGNNRTSQLALNSLIGACGRAGRPDMAMEVLHEMQEYGRTPDERSYRNAIISCNQAQHEKLRNRRTTDTSASGGHQNVQPVLEWWECAVSLLVRMKGAGLRPDVQSYSSAISACEAAGRWQRALGILQSMLNEEDTDGAGGAKEESTRLNAYCFNAAISACEKGGAWVEALEIYERMKSHGGKHLRPNIVTINSLVVALDKAGQKELAQSVYEEGIRKNIVNPWRTTRGSPRIGSPGNSRVMDLHSFSAALARAAIRAHVEDLLSPSAAKVDDWVIIVGKGLRSEGEPVLMTTVLKLLKNDYCLDAYVDDNNKGRVVVRSTAIEEFRRKHWQ